MMNRVLGERSPPAPRAVDCTRGAKPAVGRSGCRACLDACSRSAITLDPLRVDSSACDGCRLCVPVCPALALTDRPNTRRALVDSWRGLEPGAPYRLGCRRVDPDGAPSLSLRVGCVASLSWELLVIPLLLGAESVEVFTSPCSSCEYEPLRSLFEPHLRLAQAMDLGPIRVSTLDEGATGASAGVSRRGLFTALLGRGKQDAISLLAAVGDGLQRRLLPEARDEGDLNWLRSLVGVLIRRRGWSRPPIDGHRLVGRPRFDADRCTRCGLCIAACPTGAIQGADGAGLEAGFELVPERCTACDRCELVCPEAAVRLDAHVHPGEWGGGAPLLQVERAVRFCTTCGEVAMSGVVSLCSRCYATGGRLRGRTLGAPGEPRRAGFRSLGYDATVVESRERTRAERK